MVKSYWRYERESSFGVIASLDGNVLFDHAGRLAIAPALRDLAVWNVRQGTRVRTLSAPTSSSSSDNGQVTSLALHPEPEESRALVAAGYSTGVIYVFRLATGEIDATLDGHKAAVETLCYKQDGALLASGSRDTDIIVWDVVTQTGLFRLRGHKDAVTALRFAAQDALLFSASKDTLVKVWDLDTQHCVQTCIGHRSEVWSLDVSPSGERLVTGASDNQLRVWQLASASDSSSEQAKTDAATTDRLSFLGSIFRPTNDRAASVAYNPRGDLIGVQSAGKTVEIYRLRSPEDIKKKRMRREKRAREKAKKRSNQNGTSILSATSAAISSTSEENAAMDELELLCVVRSSHRIKSFAFSPDIAKDGTTSLMLALQNNSIETYSLVPNAPELDSRFAKATTLALPGHRSDVRLVAISSDDQLILSLSSASVKIWNARSLQCVRTLSDGLTLALSAAFAPGNLHVIVGTKQGALLLFDLNSAECIWKDDHAHGQSAIWSMDVRPDGLGIVTGGADQHVNFWDFEMRADPAAEQARQNKRSAGQDAPPLRLALSHARQLKMSDDVLCVRYSHSTDASKLLLAVALLDCTVKVFHDDSLKFFVSLYGHKLPVMAMDISSDDTLLVTASADKNVKLWGLDFGDCHKSIFAHQDAIMSVRFVRKTHQFFTASKDKTVCYWDGDLFERILVLDRAHFGQVWSVAVSYDGSFVVSSAQDRSICKYVRTEDQVFVEEEKDKEMEQRFEADLVAQDRDQDAILPPTDSDGKGTVAAEQNSAMATKKTIESVRAAESLMEAIELAEKEQHEIAAFEQAQRKHAAEAAAKKTNTEVELPTRQPNMLLLGYSPLKYVLQTLRRIRPSDMEEALIVLPFEYVEKLLRLLLQMISHQLEIEFCCQLVLSLLTLHATAIAQRHALWAELELLWQRLRSQLVGTRNRLGFNLAGLKFLKRQVDEERTGFVEEIAPTATSAASAAKKKRKTTKT